MSSKVLNELGIVSHKGQKVRVRLADRRVVTTDKFINVLVNFGEVSSMLRFTVLDVECPNILGMPFLKRLNPQINWQTLDVTFP